MRLAGSETTGRRCREMDTSVFSYTICFLFSDSSQACVTGWRPRPLTMVRLSEGLESRKEGHPTLVASDDVDDGLVCLGADDVVTRTLGIGTREAGGPSTPGRGAMEGGRCKHKVAQENQGRKSRRQ
jgi:hypothetical protein